MTEAHPSTEPRVDAATLDFFIQHAEGYLGKKRQESKGTDVEFALDLWTGILLVFRELKQRRADPMESYERAVRLAEEWQKTDETRKFLVAIIELAEQIGGFDHETKWRPS